MKKNNEENIWEDMNWGMIGVGIGSIAIWYSICSFGFFITLCWLVIISSIIGLWLRLTGRM